MITDCSHCFISVEETDIIELEKRYWVLKAQSKSGRFDLPTFRPIICPPVPEALCEGKTLMTHSVAAKTNPTYGFSLP